jgi:hypothetical protein
MKSEWNGEVQETQLKKSLTQELVVVAYLELLLSVELWPWNKLLQGQAAGKKIKQHFN